MTRIYLSPPDVRPLEKELLMAAVDSGWVAPVGPDLDQFEREAAAATGTRHAVGLASGTAALHLALHEAGVGTGDEVLVSTFTFVATANAVTYVGARPAFIDSEASSWNMCPELLEAELRARAGAGRLPKACVVVDLYGQCADYDRIVPLLDRYGVTLIEDAAEALGSTRRGRLAGSHGRSGIVSFNGNKIITSSGGGMLVTDDASLARQVRHLATQARQPVPHYEHTEIGFNYRLSNLLAAFGRGQLAALADRINRRRLVNLRYREGLAAVPGISFQPIDSANEPNWWLTCILVDPSRAGFDREELRLYLEGHDIESRPLWKPMHLQPVFHDAARRMNGTADALFRDGLCLPSGSGMSDVEQQSVIDRVVSLTQ